MNFKSTSYFEGIQELRGLFILLIVLSHAADFPFMPSKPVWGAAGVTGFFMIAGFLCHERTSNLNLSVKGGFANVVRTVRKIYFPYILCLLAAIFVKPGSLYDFFKCLFLTQSYWGSVSTAVSFNGNTWFLSSILLSYFFAPLLVKLVASRGGVTNVLLFSSLFLFQIFYVKFFSHLFFETGYYYCYIFPVFRMIDFTEGIVVRNLFECLRYSNRFNNWKINILATGLSLFVIELFKVGAAPRLLQYGVVWVPPIALMLLCYAANAHFRLTALEKFGDISMELFLSHRLVMFVVLNIGNSMIHFILFVLISMGIAIFLKKVRAWGRNYVTRRCKIL